MQWTTTGPSASAIAANALAEALAVALEEVDVRPRVVIGDVVDRVEMRVELGDVARVERLAEHRDVHDLDVDVARLVLGELLRPAQVDDARHAVLGERAPALVGQPADVVGADDTPRRVSPPVLGRQAAEVADVQAALPREGLRHAAAGSAPR